MSETNWKALYDEMKHFRDQWKERAERARDLQVKLEDYMRADAALTAASETWKARAEQAEEAEHIALDAVAAAMNAQHLAEADNAEIVEGVRKQMRRCLCTAVGEDSVCDWCDALSTLVDGVDGSSHPGAAMLEERQRITKTLDRMDVPSEADEAEKGRTCSLAGRVDLLAAWGQRGWREYRRLKDAEPALLERLRALERVREALGSRARSSTLTRLVYEGREKQAILAACAAADALKGES